MKNAKVFGAWVNGTWTEIKAYKKASAVVWFQSKDTSVKANAVTKPNSVNSHQSPVDAE